ncbi:hypothetical protein PspLS_09721 [Pyricularia sp. CBS 133598]|nr:hypothetical protein PspLS_09721 [Pyricularia sp. CBS 133598]
MPIKSWYRRGRRTTIILAAAFILEPIRQYLLPKLAGLTRLVQEALLPTTLLPSPLDELLPHPGAPRVGGDVVPVPILLGGGEALGLGARG